MAEAIIPEIQVLIANKIPVCPEWQSETFDHCASKAQGTLTRLPIKKLIFLETYL